MALFDQLTEIIASQTAQSTAPKAGLSEGAMAQLMPMATAMVMNRLGKNAEDPRQAEAINAALDRHDGSALSGGAAADEAMMADGAKILGHIFGGQKATAEQSLSKLGNIDQGQAQQLLAMAAPMVMGMLGQKKQEQGGFDTSMLAGLLGQERQNVQAAMPNELSGMMKMLDSDGDGDFKDDLTKLGGQMLGNLFSKK
ncbi:MAG: DUF937 domain-containing protein [bacterium]